MASGSPFLIGERGPSAVLPARVCRLLEAKFGPELARLRTELRGRDQEVAFALIAVKAAADSFVPPEADFHAQRVPVAEHKVAAESEQAAVSEWLSTSECAAFLRKGSSRAVTQAIARGTLPATRVGDRWRISRADAERYRLERTR